MMKGLTGLFLGAGASYEAGMPLAWELTRELKNWLTPQKLRHFNSLWRVQGGGYPDHVIDDLISILTLSSLHYEAVLGYLETQFLRQHASRQEYHGLYSWLVQMVYHLLYYRQINNREFLNRHLSRYDGIRALASLEESLWIFSLNHNVMIETIAARLSIPIHTGFRGSIVTLPRRDASGQKKGEIRAEVLTKAELDHGAMNFPNPLQPGIYLLKIHGALDVFTFNDGRDLLKLLPDGPGQNGFIDVLRAANEDLFYPLPGAPGGRAHATNEIAYADHLGEMQFLRRSLLAGAFKFDARPQQVLPPSMLKHFRANLNFVSNLVCVGYSFGDFHINTVLREWLEFSASRRIEIVDPSIRAVPAFLLHLSLQVALTNCGATDFFDREAGIMRSPTERLMKRLEFALRRLGKERAAQEMSDFIKQHQKSVTTAFISKLKELPLVDGQPDFSKLGDPTEAAKRWALELNLTEEAVIEQLLKHLGAADDKD